MLFNSRITFTLSVNNILLITASLDRGSLVIVQVSSIEQKEDGMLLEIQRKSYDTYLQSTM